VCVHIHLGMGVIPFLVCTVEVEDHRRITGISMPRMEILGSLLALSPCLS